MHAAMASEITGGMLNYSELNELLTNAEAEVRAAECHGFLCGHVCAAGSSDDDLWQEFIDARTDDAATARDCYREINELLGEILLRIQSQDFDFQLLLPDEDQPLVERVDALAEWCHGFLDGYGIGAAEQQLAPTEECREILEDFAKISQVGGDCGTDEEDEQALFELIEYVRMGAIIIFTEQMAESWMDDKPEMLH
jgi:hypothetical protein